MSRRTRYFVIASLVVLTVGLGAGLVAYYVGFPTAFAQQGPDELQLIPRDATVVAYADVREVMASSFRERLRAALPVAPNGHQEFHDRTGINIETDIDRVVAALVSSSGGHPKGVVLATGRFDEVKIESLMREHGAVLEDYKSRRMIVGDHDGNSFAVAFIEAGLVALGSTELVKNAIDLRDGGDSVRSNDEIMDLVRSLERGNVWALGRFDALVAQANLPSRIAGGLPPISWFSASATVNDGVRGELRAETRDEESATSLRDVVRGAIAVGKLQADTHPELGTVMRSLQLGGTGSTISLSFAVPSEVFDLLAAGVRK